MEELQAPDLAIWGVGKSEIFHFRKMKIQNHGCVSLVHTSPTSPRTPQSESVWRNGGQNTADIYKFDDQLYGDNYTAGAHIVAPV